MRRLQMTSYARPRKLHQATAVAPVLITPPGPYKTGDGDPQSKAITRPSADAHKQYKSLGLSTGEAHYPRHHP